MQKYHRNLLIKRYIKYCQDCSPKNLQEIDPYLKDFIFRMDWSLKKSGSVELTVLTVMNPRSILPSQFHLASPAVLDMILTIPDICHIWAASQAGDHYLFNICLILSLFAQYLFDVFKICSIFAKSYHYLRNTCSMFSIFVRYCLKFCPIFDKLNECISWGPPKQVIGKAPTWN